MNRAGRPNTGRPSKGDRVVTYTRPHRLVREACEASAIAQGYESLSDYIAAVLAEREGLTDLAPQPRQLDEHRDHQESMTA